MNIKAIILTIGFLVLASGCASKRWEITTPDKRYQAMVNSDPNGAARNRSRGEWTNTFSVLAPEGGWIFMSSTPFGRVFFQGAPEGIAGRYAAYEVRLFIGAMSVDEDLLELEALKTGDYDAYIEKAIERTVGKHKKSQEGYGPESLYGKHPQIPDEFSMSMIRIKGMYCRLYKDMKQRFVWTEKLGDKGPGSSEYSIGISCPGFFNGEFVSFICGSTIRIKNMHKIHGFEIDHQAVVEDLKRRIQRSLDSVQFNGEFTQVVPEKYRVVMPAASHREVDN